MRRFLSSVFLLFFALPFGLSVTGCGRKTTVAQYCNGGNSGPIVGQPASIVLEGSLATVGESLNYGQIGQGLTAQIQDCKGSPVAGTSFTYATSDNKLLYADINPTTGSVCGGSWNRNTGGGIPDYTVCSPPPAAPPTNPYFITATTGSVTSNAFPVYVHPVATSVQLATPQTACSATDPTTNCCTNVTQQAVTAPSYDGTSCVSQNNQVQLAAKVFDAAGDNITCSVGHVNFATQGSSGVVAIDSFGVATAGQPGSTLITASSSNSTAAAGAGLFSTCPPASIVLSAPGQPAGPTINVGLNNTQPLTASVLDTNGHVLTGLTLEFNSTNQQIITASAGAVLPNFPGTATITAVCQPPTCNTAPISQLGLLGNGKPLTSNGITVTAAGTSGTVIYMGSTNSQYVVPQDFTTGQMGSPIKLPFTPNSMAITADGATIYLGSPQGLMTIATATNAIAGPNLTQPGVVLSVAPNGSNVVLFDPTRQTISLIAQGAVATTYGGVNATRAVWTPDSQTVYVTTDNNVLLTHSNFSNWQVTPTDQIYNDVTVTVPSVGAYFAGAGATTDGRSYCPSTTATSTGAPPTATNVYAPLADRDPAHTDRLAATNDGTHVIGASVTSGVATLDDLAVNLAGSIGSPCATAVAPGYFTSAPTPYTLAGLTPTAIAGVVPASNSNVVFVLYTGAGGVLPMYVPSVSKVINVPLGSGATATSAPVAGVFSTDNSTFYVGDSGDDLVHLIDITGIGASAAATDAGTINPNLPDANGVITVPNLIVQRAKKTQS